MTQLVPPGSVAGRRPVHGDSFTPGRRPGAACWRPDTRSRLADERFLGAYHAELVAFGVGQHSPGLRAGLPDVDVPGAELEQPLDLPIAILGRGGDVEMHAVLEGLAIGDRHEADADRSVLVSPDDDLALPLGEDLPAERLRPEPGQPGQVVGVNDNVVQADRHAASMHGDATA